jgi:FixJ family two-component response regulator
VLPGLGVQELVAEVSKRSPATKVLYVSGYTENVVVHHGHLKEGIHFLQKPFSVDVLLDKVREVLTAT